MLAFTLCVFLNRDIVTGSPTGPIRTLRQAGEACRRTGAAHILVRPGVYIVDETVELDHRDAGPTIEGTSPDTTVLCGGIRLTGWRRAAPDRWVCNVPEGADFRKLVADGQPRPRSRFPESGRLRHRSAFDVRWMSSTRGGWERKPTEEELTTMLCDPKDLGSRFKPESAEITVYHMWDEPSVGVKSYDPKTGKMVFASPLGHPAGAFGV